MKLSILKNIKKFIWLSFITLLMTSCATFSTSQPVVHLPISKSPDQQKLAIFIDGTQNDEKTITNVFKLKNIMTLQNRNDIKTIYIEGVGTNNRVLGSIFGTGFGQDIKQAYEFLTTNYISSNNKIYIFGFSRGAYTARILSGMIQVAGIPNLSKVSLKKRKKIVDKIYDAYKNYDCKNCEYYHNINTVLKNQRDQIKTIISPYKNKHDIKIEFVGIWDTVAALALPDYEENNILKIRPRIDQLCNVKNISHALSLDDDRANIFTPLFITKAASEEQCGEEIVDRNIKQVFFSGAHSDVGGGYKDTDIDGISLNWMIGKLNNHNILPNKTGVYYDIFGKTHDPEADLSMFYHFKHRSISKYAAILDEGITIHPSVFDRLACIPRKCNEIQWLDNDNLFRHCFELNDDGTLKRTFNSKCLLKIEKDDNYTPQNTCPNIIKEISDCRDKDNSFPCKLKINAKCKKNPSVQLSNNHVYKFSLKISKKWDDQGSCSTPEDGRTISRQNISLIDKLMLYSGKLVTPLPTGGYTELLGKIHENTFFSIGNLVKKNKEFTPIKSGKLEVYANEPIGSDTYYKNNNGELYLVINKLDK